MQKYKITLETGCQHFFLVTTVILNTVTVFFGTLELHNQSFLMKVRQQSAKEEKRTGENDRQKETKDKKSPNFSP